VTDAELLARSELRLRRVVDKLRDIVDCVEEISDTIRPLNDTVGTVTWAQLDHHSRVARELVTDIELEMVRPSVVRRVELHAITVGADSIWAGGGR